MVQSDYNPASRKGSGIFIVRQFFLDIKKPFDTSKNTAQELLDAANRIAEKAESEFSQKIRCMADL